VSKVKSPKQKKALSLERDRRNTYGENAKASRKNIPRAKQRSHMEERRSVGKILAHLRDCSDESDAIEADALARTSILKSRHKAFEKTPDSPLGKVIKQKLSRRSSGPRVRATYSVGLHDVERIFDSSYDRELHRRSILLYLRYYTGPTRFEFSRHKKKSNRSKRDSRAAKLWQDAILRDAPLLRGFFAEAPEWRNKMLRWCEKTLSTASNLGHS
jgi:hypothetical protein